MNKLILSPIIIWWICQLHIEKQNLIFKIKFLPFWMYVVPLQMLESISRSPTDA